MSTTEWNYSCCRVKYYLPAIKNQPPNVALLFTQRLFDLRKQGVEVDIL
jgi:hypothetical protein